MIRLQLCAQRLQRVLKQQGFKVLWADMVFIFQLVRLQVNIYGIKVAMIESSLKQTSRDLTDIFIA